MEMEMQNVFLGAGVGVLIATWMHLGQIWVSGG
jgi:hypothetical protein